MIIHELTAVLMTLSAEGVQSFRVASSHFAVWLSYLPVAFLQNTICLRTLLIPLSKQACLAGCMLAVTRFCHHDVTWPLLDVPCREALCTLEGMLAGHTRWFFAFVSMQCLIGCSFKHFQWWFRPCSVGRHLCPLLKCTYSACCVLGCQWVAYAAANHADRAQRAHVTCLWPLSFSVILCCSGIQTCSLMAPES